MNTRMCRLLRHRDMSLPPLLDALRAHGVNLVLCTERVRGL